VAHDPQPAAAAEALERLGRLSLRELSMDSLLQTVAEMTKSVMPGNPETSVLMLVRDRPTTVVHTGRLAVDLDETQYERGHGPCLHAARSGEITEISDTRSETRWRDYTRHAAALGNLSSLSIPLPIDEEQQVAGALNIYARTPEAFDQDSRSAAARFAPYASVAAGNLHAYQSARDLADNLQIALESRAVIDQAKGILIERYKVTPDQAFQLLAGASMHSNRKLRDIADELVHTGELPLGGRTPDPEQPPTFPRGHRPAGEPRGICHGRAGDRR
jgi:GAF domain-containing protein